MWSKVSILPTLLGEKLIRHRGAPSILSGFSYGIYTPGWKKTMWSKVSILPTLLGEKLIRHRGAPSILSGFPYGIYTPGWKKTT